LVPETTGSGSKKNRLEVARCGVYKTKAILKYPGKNPLLGASSNFRKRRPKQKSKNRS